VFVTKFNTDGDYGWTFATSTSSGTAQATAIAVPWTGVVLIAGGYDGTTTLDGPGGSNTQTAVNFGLPSGFLLKLQSDGTFDSTYLMDNSQGNAMITDITLDWGNDIYLTGAFGGSVVFDGVGGSDSITAPDDHQIDSFLTKISWNNYTYSWTKIFDNTDGGSLAGALTVDWWGNVYEAGFFVGTLGFDGVGGNDSQSTTADSATYVTSWDQYGKYRYTQLIDAPSGSYNSIALGSITTYQDTLYVAGNYRQTATFDGPGGNDTHVSGSTSGDGFLSSWRVGPPLVTTDNSKVVHITKPTNGHSFTGSSVHVTGTSGANVHLAVQVDGQTEQTVLASSSGHWAATLTGLGTGAHVVTASLVTSHPIAYMSDPGNGTIHVVDIVTHGALATIDLSTENSYLTSLAVSSSGKIVVTSSGYGGSDCYVGLINPQTNAVTKLVTLADYPSATQTCAFRGIAFSPDGNTAYVAQQEDDGVVVTGQIIELNLVTHVHTNHNIGLYCDSPYSASVNPDDTELWVTCGVNVRVFDLHDFSSVLHAYTPVGSPGLYGNIVFVDDKAFIGDNGNNQIHVFKETGGLILNDFDDLSHGTNNSYSNLALNADSSRLYALDPYSDDGHQVQVFNPSTDSFVKTIYTQQPAESIAIASDTTGHMVVGDDHSSGEVYFGNDQQQSLTDGVVFEDGSFGTLNSDFLLPAGTHTFSDTVQIHLTAAADAETSGDAANDSDTTPEPEPTQPSITSSGSDTPKTTGNGTGDEEQPGLQPAAYLGIGSGLGFLCIVILLVLLRRKRTDENS